MSVHPNGNVGCCIVDYSEGIVFGNIKEQSLMDIWNGKNFNDFRLTHLKKQRQFLNVCDNCCSPYYDTQAMDILDDKADDLLKVFREE
jgi:radical SAM protein with 4Fe4S-binding SPASM domain